jgi:hypothetical protein
MAINVTPIPKLSAFATPTITFGTAAAGTATTVIRSDATIAGVGAQTSVDNAIARYNGTGGQLQGYTSGSPTITDVGIITAPAQPAFLAFANDIADVTGDGTDYTVIFARSLPLNQGGAFNGTTTFTAPVAGVYRFTASVRFGGMNLSGAANNGECRVVTTNVTYYYVTNTVNVEGPASGATQLFFSVLADMDADDICTVVVDVSGGNKKLDIDQNSFFCGEKVA